MYKSLRFVNRILAVVVLLASLTLGACGAEVPDSGITVVTSEQIAQLPPGQQLEVDLSGTRTYTFDYRAQPIDYSRITVITAEGEKLPMPQWLAANQAATGVDLTVMPDKVFRIGEQIPGPGEVGAQCGCKYVRVCVPLGFWQRCWSVKVCW